MNTTTTSIFDTKLANEWMALSKEKPTPKFLFAEFWLEGELSILFADTGKGKSILAVQIAESIARGVAIKPLKLTSKPQKVLYLDFELSDKQFEMRYSKDAGDNDSRHRVPSSERPAERPTRRLQRGRAELAVAGNSPARLGIQ